MYLNIKLCVFFVLEWVYLLWHSRARSERPIYSTNVCESCDSSLTVLSRALRSRPGLIIRSVSIWARRCRVKNESGKISDFSLAIKTWGWNKYNFGRQQSMQERYIYMCTRRYCRRFCDMSLIDKVCRERWGPLGKSDSLLFREHGREQHRTRKDCM